MAWHRSGADGLECAEVVQCAAQEVAPMYRGPYGIIGLIVAILLILLLLRLLGVI